MPPQYDNQLCKYIMIIDITDISQNTAFNHAVGIISDNVIFAKSYNVRL